MKCKNCGFLIKEDKKFCTNCGCKIEIDLEQISEDIKTTEVNQNKTSSLNEVIKIIEKFSNKEARVNNQPRAFRDPDVVLPSLSKSKQILDWEPSTNIEEGIKSTIEWYSSFQDKIKDYTYIE